MLLLDLNFLPHIINMFLLFELLNVFLKLCCKLYLQRSASEKPAKVSSKEPISTSIVDTPLISGLVSDTVSNRIENSSFGKGESAILASEGQISSNKKSEDKPSDIAVPNDPVKITLEQAAIVVLAFFRGSQVLVLVSLLLVLEILFFF